MRKLVLITTAVAVVALAVFDGRAGATTTCSFNSTTHTLTVNMPADNDAARIVRSGSNIAVAGKTCSGPTPTVTNTDLVNVTGGSGRGKKLTIDLSGGSFSRAGGDIQFHVDLVNCCGYDTLSIKAAAAGSAITFGSTGINLDRGDGDSDVTLVNAGNLWYAEFLGAGGNDIVSGAGGEGTGGPFPAFLNLYGGPGSEVLTGGASVDTIDGGLGNDTIDGGGSGNTAGFFLDPQAVTVDLAAGTATGQGTDTLTNVDSVWGSPAGDLIYGDAGGNFLVGDAGNDTIYGRDGADQLVDDAGSNTLYGGNGDDRFSVAAGASLLVGGAGSDRADFGSGLGPVTVDLAAGTANGPNLSDTLIGIENAGGTNNGDTLRGDANTNFLSGGGGNDTIEGRGGADVLDGGSGSNTLDGGSGSDWVSYAGERSGATVALGAHIGGVTGRSDSLTSIEDVLGSPYADTIGGDNGPNAIWAGPGDDKLFGNGGDDVLQGGKGDDSLDGGAGHDTCVQGPGIGTKTDCEA